MIQQPQDGALAAVGSALTGPLASCRHLLAPAGAPDIVSASSLLAKDRLGDALEGYAANFPGADRRAIVSMWASWYLGVFIPPAMASCLVLSKRPALGLADIGLHLAPAGHVGAVHFRDLVAEPAPDDVLARIEPLIDHLSVFTSAVAAFGPSAKLIWGSAASYAEWTASAVATGTGPADLVDCLLKTRLLPSGRANPFFDRLRTVEEDGVAVRRRRVCCLRYQLPGVPGCGSACPLPEGRTDTPS